MAIGFKNRKELSDNTGESKKVFLLQFCVNYIFKNVQ